MKTITSILLIPLAAARSNDEVPRQLQQECVLRSTYVGCYSDKKLDRALPFEVFGPKSRKHSAEECEAACAAAGYDVWGIQFTGQCFCGDTSGVTKHGEATGCECCGDNVGSNKFCAYALDTTAPGCGGTGVSVSSSYVGCYANKNKSRALPVQIPGKGHSAQECEIACAEEGYEYFAREWKGQW